MTIVDYHQGCPVTKTFSGCYGPQGSYYTIFGSELRYLMPHIVISIIIGLISLSILYNLDKKHKISLPKYLIFLLPIITIIFLFFILAYLFPTIMLY